MLDVPDTCFTGVQGRLRRQVYGGTGPEDGAAITDAPNGDLFLHGNTSSFGNTGPDLWLARLDSSLDLFQLGKTITTAHANTKAKSRPLAFTSTEATLNTISTSVQPKPTTSRVMPTVGN